MTAYDAGEAFLQIVPSFRGVQAKIDAEVKRWNESIRLGLADAIPSGLRASAPATKREGDKQGDEFGGAFARSVRRRIEAGLKALPKVEIHADSSDADLAIAAIRAQLEDLRTKRIGIDIDEGLALAQIAALEGQLRALASESPNLQVRVDAFAAAAELAAVQTEVDRLDGRTAHIHLDVDRGGIPGDAAGGGGILGGLLGGPSGGLGLGSLAVAAAPLAAPLGAAAAGLGAGITTVAGAGAGALGTLVVGLSNVHQAVQDIADAHTQAGAAAGRSAAEQLRAALAVTSAERGVTNALDQQQAAERALSDAQRSQRDATLALTDARKQAKQQIEDLNQAVADGALSQRQAALDVNRARLNLQDVNSNPLSTQLDRQQARLDYDTAIQRQKDLATQQQRTKQAAKDANRAGVDGAQIVLQAQQNLARANDQVAAAYKGIQRAAENVTFAMAQLRVAQLSAASSGSKQLQEVQERLKALSPAALAFATFINGTLKPAFSGLRDAIQASLLPRIQEGLAALMPILPGLTDFMSGLATVLGDVFIEASKALGSPFWQRFFGYVTATAGPVLKTFLGIMGNLATGFAGLLIAFKPVVMQIGDGLLTLTDRFARWAEQLGSDKGFQAFLAFVEREGPKVADFFGNLIGVIGQLLEGLAPLGDLMLTALNTVLELIHGLGPEGLLLAIGAVATVVAVLGGPITAIVVAVTAFTAAITHAYQHVKPFHDFIDQHVLPILHELWAFIRDHVIPVLQSIVKDALAGAISAFHDIRDAISRNHPQLQKLYDLFKVFITFIVDKILPILGPVLALAFKALGTQISSVIDGLGMFEPVIAAATKLWLGFLGQIIHAAATAFGWIPGIGGKLKNASKEFDQFAKDVNAALSGVKGVTVAVIPGYANPQDLTIAHRYAIGGPVRGPGTGTSDSIPALLSNGEHVWTAEEVAKLGGHQAMMTLRRVVRGYAVGGPVMDPRSLAAMAPRAGAASMGQWDLTALAQARPGLGTLHYEQHLHYPTPDGTAHGQMRAQQLLLHDLSNW